MSIENARSVERTTNRRPQIVDSLKRLEERFGREFSGARQATRSRLVRFLANALDTAEESAGESLIGFRRLVSSSEPKAQGKRTASAAHPSIGELLTVTTRK